VKPASIPAMLAATADSEHPSRVVVRRRFRHRMSMAGAELHYLVLVAVKD